TWFDDFGTVLEWDLPFAKWFIGGTLNVSYNCLDRHVAAGLGDKVAYHWEGEPGDTRTITYADLLDEVQRFANVLKGLGVKRGDRVAIYMPMIPELPVAMLACTRVGAAHSVVFGGFSSDALRDRINDAEAKVLITSDGGYRRGTTVPLKANVDVALADTPSIEHVVVVRGRHRLGHRPQLHRVRAARQRRHQRDVRGHARLPRQGPVVVDHREVRRHHPLLRAHRHPHVHEVGHAVSRGA